MQRDIIKQDGKHSNAKYALAAFLAVVIFVIIYKYSLNMLKDESINDTFEHTMHAQNIYLDRLWNSWLKRPYLFWHLCVKACIKFFEMPVKEASSFTCSMFSVFGFYTLFHLIDRTASKLARRDMGMIAACTAAMLGLVQPMYVYWFNTYQYEGQFTINPIFNPTHMAVKPIGMLCFMLAMDLIRCYKGEEQLFFPGIRSIKWLYLLFSILLLLSAFTKPTFMYMLLPAGVIYLLIELITITRNEKKNYERLWGFTWRTALSSVPAILYLLLEYTAFYYWGGTNEDAQVAIYPFLTAWHLYSPNVPKSWLLSMSFPFWIVLTNWRYFLHSIEGRFATIGYAVGTLEFCFIVETGAKLGHMNFAWPMQSGMLLIWAASAVRLVYLSGSDETGCWNKIVVSIGWILLSIHLFSGLYYINPYMYII